MNRERVYNFSAGSSMLPLEVLERAQAEMLNYNDTGMSVAEISNRSAEFREILSGAEEALRSLMNIPQNYRIFFIGGGESLQFAGVPMNLLSSHRCADYIVSGQFAKKACDEAKKYGDVVIAASSGGASPPYSTVPMTKRADFRPDADYVHICFNNTVYGTKFHYIPDTGNIPLVADMTSCILSEPFDVSKFGLIYAGGQINIAPSGLTVVIVRGDLIGDARPDTPSMLDYRLLAENSSMYNAPPIFGIYMAKLVLEWIISVGGLEEMKRRNEKKASLLYDYLDGRGQSYYTAPVDKKCRSMMNVVFVTGDGQLDRKFAEEAAKEGLINLEGAPGVGGLCASLYNSMPYEGVERLVEFMKDFAKNNPKLSG
jgi:phosphoserine aminotransferase